MPRKQRPAKQQEGSSFLTLDFLKRQKLSLEAKLSDCQNLRRSALREIKVSSSGERKGDATEQTITANERRNAAQRLEECGKTISQVIRALDLINDDLFAGEKNGKSYGVCVNC